MTDQEGADLDLRDEEGLTALHLSRSRAVAQVLIKHGANPWATNKVRLSLRDPRPSAPRVPDGGPRAQEGQTPEQFLRAEKPTFGWGQRGGSGKFAQPRHPKDGLEVGQMLSQNTSAPPARAAAAPAVSRR